MGIGGVVKLADFGPLGRLGCARAAEACTYSAPEVLRKVCRQSRYFLRLRESISYP